MKKYETINFELVPEEDYEHLPKGVEDFTTKSREYFDVNEKQKALLKALDSLSESLIENSKDYEKGCNDWWSSLSYNERLMAFYSVCKRIHKGDIEERRSYRGVIYDVFKFGPDAYSTGMDCGYMDIHNYIIKGIEADHKEIELVRKEKENGTT
jgi:hypothetical protein